jgi:preprotein translocase subunit SecB
MSDATDTPANGSGEAGEAAEQPSVNCLTQYVKDLSFENPNGPEGPAAAQGEPNVDMNIQIGINAQPDNIYEVTLAVDGKASRGETDLFVIELHYSGLFELVNVPAEHLDAVLYVHCATLLFPFARQIVAETTRNGGYPPLLLSPMDFTALFQQHIAKSQQA